MEAHNERFLAGEESHYLELNKFADLTAEEFATRMGLISGAKNPFLGGPNGLTFKGTDTDIPDSVDWRDEGLVGPVKDQGQCGSCWAFSTIVSLEGQQAKKTGSYVSLSEQNIVDCVKGESDCCDGCDGGLSEYRASFLHLGVVFVNTVR